MDEHRRSPKPAGLRALVVFWAAIALSLASTIGVFLLLH